MSISPVGLVPAASFFKIADAVIVVIELVEMQDLTHSSILLPIVKQITQLSDTFIEAKQMKLKADCYAQESAMAKLFTIGYEGTDLEDFLNTLQKADMDVLLDVREIPISRRKGFSKSALREALVAAGIDYRHERQLGSPKEIRHRLREDGNYKRFFREFGRHLDKQMGLLEQLAEELQGNIALMCYERDHTTCHRSAVVNALAKLLNAEPIHLGIDDDEPRKASEAPYPDFSEGLTPA